MEFLLELLSNRGLWVLVIIISALAVALVVHKMVTSDEVTKFLKKPTREATLGDICFILFIFGCLISI